MYTLDMNLNGVPIYPVLLWSEQDGATLIDTGMVGSFAELQEAVAATGIRWTQIRRVILTHQDIDHIGNLPEVVASLNGKVEIWAHEGDSPVIEGKQPLLKMSQERLQQMPEASRAAFLKLFEELKQLQVSRLLKDGELLPLGGGLEVIHTPGHTPGHLSFYAHEAKLIIAADALRVEGGQLVGPNEPFTPDMPLSLKSLNKLVGRGAEQVLCYHGGLYQGDPDTAINKISK